MVMPYHLHMPSYFLETFTEYPYFMERVTSWLICKIDARQSQTSIICIACRIYNLSPVTLLTLHPTH